MWETHLKISIQVVHTIMVRIIQQISLQSFTMFLRVSPWAPQGLCLQHAPSHPPERHSWGGKWFLLAQTYKKHTRALRLLKSSLKHSFILSAETKSAIIENWKWQCLPPVEPCLREPSHTFRKCADFCWCSPVPPWAKKSISCKKCKESK